jgi:fumarate hydratase subunit beta
MQVVQIQTPVNDDFIKGLSIGDQLAINGKIFCGRDAVLPKIVTLFLTDRLHTIDLDLKGAVIFHTAVSPAGIGPTTSNKVEIESSIPTLSKAGIKIHLGKGAINQQTVLALKENNSAFAVTPPTSALFTDKMISKKVAAFPEEGMEALYEIEVQGFPAIIASVNGKTIFSSQRKP